MDEQFSIRGSDTGTFNELLSCACKIMDEDAQGYFYNDAVDNKLDMEVLLRLLEALDKFTIQWADGVCRPFLEGRVGEYDEKIGEKLHGNVESIRACLPDLEFDLEICCFNRAFAELGLHVCKALERRADEAIQAANTADIWNLYDGIAWSPFSKPREPLTYKHKYLLDEPPHSQVHCVLHPRFHEILSRLQNAHHELGAALRLEYKEDYEDVLSAIKARVAQKEMRLVFASSSEVGNPGTDEDGWPVLYLGKWAADEMGGDCIAGDAFDRFHKKLMTEEEMEYERKGWRSAWKGKGVTLLEWLKKPARNTKMLALFAIKGGPETEWERAYLQNEFVDAYPEMKDQIEIITFESLADFFSYLSEDIEGLFEKYEKLQEAATSFQEATSSSGVCADLQGMTERDLSKHVIAECTRAQESREGPHGLSVADSSKDDAVKSAMIELLLALRARD